MVNINVQGKQYPASQPYLVGREKVREFAHAVKSTCPTNFDVFAAQAAGYTDVVAPPTFAVVLQQLGFDAVISDPEASLDFARVVHGDQRFVHVRPIVAGDELVTEMAISQIRQAGSLSMVTFECKIYDVEKELVCTAISTLVERGDA